MNPHALTGWSRRIRCGVALWVCAAAAFSARAQSPFGLKIERLALAAERVLAIVEEHPGDRAIALDLLAADALITLALLAQAEQAPEQLGAFAAGLLSAERIA